MPLQFCLRTRKAATWDVVALAHVFMRQKIFFRSGEVASIVPTRETQVGFLDGPLSDQVTNPLSNVTVQRDAARWAGFSALGAPLASDMPGRALEDLEMGDGVTDSALEHLLHFALADCYGGVGSLNWWLLIILLQRESPRQASPDTQIFFLVKSVKLVYLLQHALHACWRDAADSAPHVSQCNFMSMSEAQDNGTDLLVRANEYCFIPKLK